MRHFHWQPWDLENLTPEQLDGAFRDLQANPPGAF